MTDEQGMTVSPDYGLEILERAKEGICQAFEGKGDSPASAVLSALVGYRNALAEIERLRAELRCPSCGSTVVECVDCAVQWDRADPEGTDAE